MKNKKLGPLIWGESCFYFFMEFKQSLLLFSIIFLIGFSVGWICFYHRLCHVTGDGNKVNR
jgi:hypothetical protein